MAVIGLILILLLVRKNEFPTQWMWNKKLDVKISYAANFDCKLYFENALYDTVSETSTRIEPDPFDIVNF